MNEVKSQINKGDPVRVIKVTDPRAEFKSAYPKYSAISILIFIIAVEIWMALSGATVVVMLATADVLILALVVIYLFLVMNLGRSTKPITIYQHGISFPLFGIDKFGGRVAFLPKEKIAKIDVLDVPKRVGGIGAKRFIITTKTRKLYDSGARASGDVDSAVEWMRSTWHIGEAPRAEKRAIPQEAPSDRAKSGGKRVRKVPVSSLSKEACAACGTNIPAGKNVCPSCGKEQ